MNIIPFLIIVPLNAQDFVRNRDECLREEVLKKLKGTWIVDSVIHFVNKKNVISKSRLDIPEERRDKKLTIGDDFIQWEEPMYDFKTKKLEKQYCKLSSMKIFRGKVMNSCYNCNKEDYEFSSPYDVVVNVSNPYRKTCDDSQTSSKYDLLEFTYNTRLKRIGMADFFQGLFLKKMTPMKDIDFSVIENCDHSFQSCEECEGLVREDNSVLKSLEGEWEVFKVSHQQEGFPEMSEEEREDLIGKKILVTEEGFRFLSKLDSYSRNYYDYYCPSKRALIVHTTFDKVDMLAKKNNSEYVSAGFTLFNAKGPMYVKTKKGIKFKPFTSETKVLYIDNPCQITIFDTILVFFNKTMVLQLEGDYLYLNRVKKKK